MGTIYTLSLIFISVIAYAAIGYVIWDDFFNRGHDTKEVRQTLSTPVNYFVVAFWPVVLAFNFIVSVIITIDIIFREFRKKL